MRSRRSGFALVAALWLVAFLSVTASAGLRAVYLEEQAALNRRSLERSHWAAEACLALAVEGLSASTAAHGLSSAAGRLTLELPNATRCATSVAEPGARLNRFTTSPEALARLDSLASQRGLPADSFLTDDGDGRVDVNAAPFEVLAAMAAFGTEGARALIERRRWGPFPDMNAVLATLVVTGVRGSAGALQDAIALAPTSLVITAAGFDDTARPVSRIEVLVVPVGTRVGVLRRRQ